MTPGADRVRPSPLDLIRNPAILLVLEIQDANSLVHQKGPAQWD